MGEGATARTQVAFFMDKTEILNRLKQSGLINRFKNEKLWQLAFDLYNHEHKTKLRPNCGVCFKTVKNWLEKWK